MEKIYLTYNSSGCIDGFRITLNEVRFTVSPFLGFLTSHFGKLPVNFFFSAVALVLLVCFQFISSLIFVTAHLEEENDDIFL